MFLDVRTKLLNVCPRYIKRSILAALVEYISFNSCWIQSRSPYYHRLWFLILMIFVFHLSEYWWFVGKKEAWSQQSTATAWELCGAFLSQSWVSVIYTVHCELPPHPYPPYTRLPCPLDINPVEILRDCGISRPNLRSILRAMWDPYPKQPVTGQGTRDVVSTQGGFRKWQVKKNVISPFAVFKKNAI